MSEEATITVPFLGPLFKGITSLINGMKVTLHYLIRPKTVVTQQYPENRNELQMFDRFRARLTMIHDENGFHKCTACRFCEMSCPNGSIKVMFREKPAIAKNELDALIWRLDCCTFCNACVQVCPFGVLKFEPQFENSVYDRRLLVYNLSRYAGPPSTVLAKVEDPAERVKAVEPRTPYYGPLPMTGKKLAGVDAVGDKEKTEEKDDDSDSK